MICEAGQPRASLTPGGKRLSYAQNGKAAHLAGDDILVSAGCVPTIGSGASLKAACTSRSPSLATVNHTPHPAAPFC